MPDDSLPRPPRATISRRRLLGGAVAAGGIGALGGGVAGPAGAAVRLASRQPGRSAASTPVENPAAPAFRSRPDLLPPRLQVAVVTSDPSAGVILLTSNALPTRRVPGGQVAQGLGQVAVAIVDERGELVWMLPLGSDALVQQATNLQVTTYEGEPVLTYWVGQNRTGIGFGEGYVLDSSYRQVAVVKAGNGLRADLHELQLTPQGTALVTAYAQRTTDLSALKGPSDGVVWDSAVQEIDVKTGKVLLDWRSLDHVPVTDSYGGFGAVLKGGSGAGTAAEPFDYFHVNSIAPYGNDELLVSARNTWALYRIDRKTGTVVARINGKRSSYEIGPGANFYWQHHARLTSPGVLTVFDDGAAPPEEPTSRGLVLSIDDTKMTVDLKQAFVHPARLLTPYEGSMQLLGDGGAFVGWGANPYFTQFAENGSVVFDGRFPTGDQSYRAFRSPWVATPATPPDVAVQADTLGGQVVYVSWNGATQVAQWQVLNGSSPASLKPLVTVPKAGFETAISTRPTARVVAVAALDASGKRIGLSRPVTVTLAPA